MFGWLVDHEMTESGPLLRTSICYRISEPICRDDSLDACLALVETRKLSTTGNARSLSDYNLDYHS